MQGVDLCRQAAFQAAVLAHQRRRRPAPLLDASGYRGNLGIRVGPGVFRVWDQPIDRPALDLVGRPRLLISRLLSRAGARTRRDRGSVVVSVAAALELEADTIKEARLALGGVAHKPWRDPSAEAALHGQAASQATFTRAADLLLRDAKGFEHNAFKIGLARRVIVRALTQAAAGTPQSQSQSNKKIR